MLNPASLAYWPQQDNNNNWKMELNKLVFVAKETVFVV